MRVLSVKRWIRGSATSLNGQAGASFTLASKKDGPPSGGPGSPQKTMHAGALAFFRLIGPFRHDFSFYNIESGSTIFPPYPHVINIDSKV